MRAIGTFRRAINRMRRGAEARLAAWRAASRGFSPGAVFASARDAAADHGPFSATMGRHRVIGNRPVQQAAIVPNPGSPGRQRGCRQNRAGSRASNSASKARPSARACRRSRRRGCRCLKRLLAGIGMGAHQRVLDRRALADLRFARRTAAGSRLASSYGCSAAAINGSPRRERRQDHVGELRVPPSGELHGVQHHQERRHQW